MNNKRAFTLIELSMSLVIISMLIALIATGSSLISTAENRKIIADFNNYKVAINNFKSQYGQLPGDFSNAAYYWLTNNGNGNGIIDYTPDLNNDESLAAWQHLSLAGYISGNYSGVRATTGLNTIGTNVPSSQIIAAGWAFYSIQAYSTNSINSLIFGAANLNSINDQPAITTKAAFDIDNKIDDGSARTGLVLGLYSDDPANGYGTGATNACVQNTTATDATANNIASNGYYYVNIDNGQARCALQFIF